MAKYRYDIEQVLTVIKSLSDFSRLRAFMMLEDGELCVCQLIEMLGLAPSTVSKHMSILKQARLVRSRKSGRWIYYSITEDSSQAKGILMWLKENLADDSQIIADGEQLKEIKKIDKDELCRCYKSLDSR